MPNPQEARRAAEEEAMRLVRKAKMHVAIYHCFYGALLERLKLKADWRHSTMYTDAVVIGFNPTFVLGKTWEHLVYIMIHEVTHCALGHPFRRNGRPPGRWNKAIDHVTNLSLNRDPMLKAMFPPEGLADERFVGLAAEQVDAILAREEQQEEQKQKEEQKQPLGEQGPPVQAQAPEGNEEHEEELAGAAGSMGDCCDAGASGEPLPDDKKGEEDEEDQSQDAAEDAKRSERAQSADSDSTGLGDGDEQDGSPEETQTSNAKPQNDQAAIERLAREWQEAVMTAQLAAGGDIDSAMQRALGAAQRSRKSFAEYVDEFAARCCSVDSSWNKPARRFETYLPSYCQPGVKTLIVGVDTSASINNNDLALFESATQRIMDDFNLRACIVVYCDSQIRGIERFEAGEQITLANAKGGGGTRFHPVFRYAIEQEQLGEELAGVIYLSDLDGRCADAEDFAHLQILWATPQVRRTLEAPAGLGSVCSLYDA